MVIDPEDMFLSSGQTSAKCVPDVLLDEGGMFLSPRTAVCRNLSTCSCGVVCIAGRRGTYKAPPNEASYMCLGNVAMRVKQTRDVLHIGCITIACIRQHGLAYQN